MGLPAPDLPGGWRLCAHRIIWLGAGILGSLCSEQPLGASLVRSLRSHRRLLPGRPGGVCGPRLACHPLPVVCPALPGGRTLLTPSRWPEVGGQPGAGAVSPAPILTPLAPRLVETRWSKGALGHPHSPYPPRHGFLLF